MIIGLQIIAIIFSLLMIYLSVLNYKRREINAIEFASWVAIWTSTVLVVIFPEVLRSLASKFFITRLFDLMVVFGFILVISLSLKAYLTSKKTRRMIEDMVRDEAIGKTESKLGLKSKKVK